MGRAKTGRKAAPDCAALWANSASKSIQTHNGTLGTLAAERLPRSRNSPIESNLTPPSFPPLFLLYHPPHPHSPIHFTFSTPPHSSSLYHLKPAPRPSLPKLHICPPLYNHPLLPRPCIHFIHCILQRRCCIHLYTLYACLCLHCMQSISM